MQEKPDIRNRLWRLGRNLQKYVLMPIDGHRDRFKYFLLHMMYLVSGTVTVLIGPMLPILAKRFDLGDMDAGAFFPAQFAGSLAGTIASSTFGRRGRYYDAAWLGGSAMAAGAVLLSTNSRAVVIAGFFLVGIGIGLTLPSINILVVERAGENAGTALSILNLCWGIGAILCKPFVDATVSAGSTFVTSLTITVALILVSVLLLAIRQAIPKISADGSTVNSVKGFWRLWPAVLIAGFNFVHVGFETSVGGWLAAYTERIGGTNSSYISPVLMYFILFVAGRAAAPVLMRYIKESMMIPLGLVIMLAGVVTLLFSENISHLIVGASLAGFGTSWIFPINISRFHKLAGEHGGIDPTPFFLMGTFGAAGSTWLIGYVSETAGSLRTGMSVLLACVILLVIMQTALHFFDRKKQGR